MTEPGSFADAVLATIDRLAEPVYRTPIQRTGERPWIPYRRRRLIYERDGYTCTLCGRGGVTQLDHIIPWSAGGTDHAENLRAVCQPCNEDRSNWMRPGEQTRPRLPVTARCVPCQEDYVVHPALEDAPRVRAYCGTCGLTSWVLCAMELA